MQLLSLIRHGQAGSRQDYDRLSETGRNQARLLGQWLVRQRTRFDAVVVGGLKRQRETAEIVLEILSRGGLAPDEVLEDPGWSEFDIDSVFASVAPRLAQADAGFRSAYQSLLQASADGGSPIHRQWTAADTAVVQSWVSGQFETETESWQEFTARVRDALSRLPSRPHTAVFTSATPVGVCVAGCFASTSPDRILHLAGAALNTNITSLIRRDGAWRLYGFNLAAHLEEPELRTHR